MAMPSKETMEQIIGGLDMLSQDASIPRNIRRKAEEAKKILMKEDNPLDVRVASVTSLLDELANDPNIPLHGRTLIWSIMSKLEELV
jgi:hypothetical protein